MLHIYVYLMKKHPQIDKTFPHMPGDHVVFSVGESRQCQGAQTRRRVGEEWLVAHGLPPKEIQKKRRSTY